MRVAQELRDGMTVNLGIGLPTLVSNFIPEGMQIFLQAENGMLGYGRIADDGEFDQDLINAGGQPVTLLPGASFFSSADAFAMIRGGHIDLTVLGGLQVSARGDLANWAVAGRVGGGRDEGPQGPASQRHHLARSIDWFQDEVIQPEHMSRNRFFVAAFDGDRHASVAGLEVDHAQADQLPA